MKHWMRMAQARTVDAIHDASPGSSPASQSECELSQECRICFQLNLKDTKLGFGSGGIRSFGSSIAGPG